MFAHYCLNQIDEGFTRWSRGALGSIALPLLVAAFGVTIQPNGLTCFTSRPTESKQLNKAVSGQGGNYLTGQLIQRAIPMDVKPAVNAAAVAPTVNGKVAGPGISEDEAHELGVTLLLGAHLIAHPGQPNYVRSQSSYQVVNIRPNQFIDLDPLALGADAIVP